MQAINVHEIQLKKKRLKTSKNPLEVPQKSLYRNQPTTDYLLLRILCNSAHNALSQVSPEELNQWPFQVGKVRMLSFQARIFWAVSSSAIVYIKKIQIVVEIPGFKKKKTQPENFQKKSRITFLANFLNNCIMDFLYNYTRLDSTQICSCYLYNVVKIILCRPFF